MILEDIIYLCLCPGTINGIVNELQRLLSNHRETRKANKAANAATVLGSGCCSGASGLESVKRLVKGKKGAVVRALDFRKPRVGGD